MGTLNRNIMPRLSSVAMSGLMNTKTLFPIAKPRTDTRQAVASWDKTTYFPPRLRNGAQECNRRLKQGLGGLNCG